MPRALTRLTVVALVLHLAGVPAAAAVGPIAAAATRAVQRASADEPALWKAMLAGLEPGALVAVRLKDGPRILGTVLQVGDETFTFKRRTRIPIPAEEIAFRDVATIERQAVPMSPGKKVAIGVAAGGGAFLLVGLLLAAAISD